MVIYKIFGICRYVYNWYPEFNVGYFTDYTVAYKMKPLEYNYSFQSLYTLYTSEKQQQQQQ